MSDVVSTLQENAEQVLEARARYNDFIQALTNTRTELEREVESLSACIQTFDDTAVRLELVQENEVDNLSTCNEAVLLEIVELQRNDEPLRGMLTEKTNQFSDACSSQFEELHEKFQQVSESRQTTLSSNAEVLQHLESAESKLVEWRGQLSTDLTGITSAHQQLEVQLEQLLSHFTSTAGGMDQGLSTFERQIVDTLAASLTQSFSELDGQLDATLDTQFTTAMETTKSEFARIEQDLTSACQEGTEQLVLAVGGIVEEMRTHVSEEFVEHVQELFEDLVKDAIASLAAEAVESTTMATIGTATTGALQPLFPQLLLAKKALSLINSFT